MANHDIQVGDIITAANGTPVTTVLEFRDVIEGLKAGDSVSLTLWRDEDLMERLKALQAIEDASAAAEVSQPDASASAEEEYTYHFHEIGEVEVKLVDAAMLQQPAEGEPSAEQSNP